MKIVLLVGIRAGGTSSAKPVVKTVVSAQLQATIKGLRLVHSAGSKFEAAGADPDIGSYFSRNCLEHTTAQFKTKTKIQNTHWSHHNLSCE